MTLSITRWISCLDVKLEVVEYVRTEAKGVHCLVWKPPFSIMKDERGDPQSVRTSNSIGFLNTKIEDCSHRNIREKK